MKNFEIRPLEWDSNYFQVKSSKVILNKQLRNDEKNDLLLKMKQYEFITIQNVNNEPLNNHWIGSSTTAFLTDVNVQFIKPISANDPKTCVTEKVVISNNFDFHDEIVDIASESFVYSRFYNDPNIDKNKSREIYKNWVINSFHNEKKYFTLIFVDGKISGFLLFSFIDSHNSVIELIAISSQFQKMSLGMKLIHSTITFLREKNKNFLQVGTQIDNVQAMNFYTKNGFKLNAKSSIYHYWPKK